MDQKMIDRLREVHDAQAALPPAAPVYDAEGQQIPFSPRLVAIKSADFLAITEAAQGRDDDAEELKQKLADLRKGARNVGRTRFPVNIQLEDLKFLLDRAGEPAHQEKKQARSQAAAGEKRKDGLDANV